MVVHIFSQGVLLGTATRSGDTVYVRASDGAPIGAVANFDAAAALLLRRTQP